jgi:hypothetical protein
VTGLQSRLFKSDPALEAWMIRDASHVTRGNTRVHVAKIQSSLFLWSYQSQADDIVGKMTIAALDRELLATENWRSPGTRPTFDHEYPFKKYDGFEQPNKRYGQSVALLSYAHTSQSLRIPATTSAHASPSTQPEAFQIVALCQAMRVRLKSA